MPSNALPPLVALTPTDHGAIVVVVAWCFAGFTLVAAGARTAITLIHKQGFHRDDVGYFSGAVSIFLNQMTRWGFCSDGNYSSYR
jgi:hypothetical protein